jgi:hypothetical protein
VKCTDILRLAPPYITGELEPELYADFDAHLKTCRACMEQVHAQSRLDARLRDAVLAQETNVTEVDRRVRELIAAGEEASPVSKTRSSLRRRAARLVGVAAALVLLAAGYSILVSAPVSRVYAEAAKDHQIEIVEQQPRPWLTDPAQIGSLAEQQGIAPDAVTRLASGNYRLVQGRLCFLGYRIFLHLVFSNGGREFSVYLRQRDGMHLPGPVRGTVNGRPLCATDVNRKHIASIETDQLIAVAVSDESSDAGLNFAHFAASVL